MLERDDFQDSHSVLAHSVYVLGDSLIKWPVLVLPLLFVHIEGHQRSCTVVIFLVLLDNLQHFTLHLVLQEHVHSFNHLSSQSFKLPGSIRNILEKPLQLLIPCFIITVLLLVLRLLVTALSPASFGRLGVSGALRDLILLFVPVDRGPLRPGC